MTEVDVTGFRQVIDGQPSGAQEAILAAFLLGGGDEEALRKGLIQRMGQTLGAVSMHEHFQAKLTPPAELVDDTKPEAEITSPAKTIEADQEILLRAEDVREQFISLATRKPKKGSNAAKRDRQFLVNAFQEIVNAVGETDQHIVHQPTIIARMLESWLVTVDEDETGRTDELLNATVNYLGEKIKKDWHKIPTKTLAGYAQELAHDTLAEERLEKLLKGYFEGPKSRIERLQAYSNLCLSTQYALNDQAAIDKIAAIITFSSTILSRGGDYHKDMVCYELDLAKVHQIKIGDDARRFSEAVCYLSSNVVEGGSLAIYDRTLFEQSEAAMRANIKVYMDETGCNFEEAKIEMTNRSAIMEEYAETIVVTLDTVEAIRLKYGDAAAQWFGKIRFGETEAGKEFFRTFGQRAESIWRKEFLLQEKNFKTGDLLIIPVGDDMIFELFLPEGLSISLADYALIREQYLATPTPWPGTEEARGDSQNTDLVAMPVKFKDHTVYTSVRPRCELDDMHEHQLNLLLWHDIPDLGDAEFISSQEIAQRIKDNQRWFVGPRTFEVTFKSDEMVQAGFEKIAFRRPEDKKSIYVTLTHKGQVIEYRINSNWQLELEGKGIHSTKLKDIIERRTLAILEAYSTQEVLETSKGTISERGSSPGIGYVPAMLVWVGGFKGNGEPKGFSDDQWLEYLEKEGKDLAVASAKRQEREDSNGRMSTYRKSYGLPDGPPIELYVDDERII